MGGGAAAVTAVHEGAHVGYALTIAEVTRELMPCHPAAAVFAATSVALPPLTQHSDRVLTDSVLLAVAAALLAALVRTLRRGLSGRLMTLVAVLAAASGLARAAGMVIAGLALGASPWPAGATPT